MNPYHPSFDEELGLNGFLAILHFKPDVANNYAGRYLRADKIEYLRNKCPRTNFKSNQEWANAVIKEIKSALLPVSSSEDHPLAKISSLLLSSATFTDDFFDKELKLDERLDIMIDRAVKRLIQIKAIKQMLGQADAERGEDRVRKFGVKKAANG